METNVENTIKRIGGYAEDLPGVIIEDGPVYRMYSLVVRQLSPMQKGVQTTHAVANYALYHAKEEDWLKWAEVDQTLIILDGGTAPDLEQIETEMSYHNIVHENFYEPDLNDMMTSVVVLAPEQVWNKETYPEFEDWCILNGYDENQRTSWLVFNVESKTWEKDEKTYAEAYGKWTSLLGGSENVYLRNLLSSKRLAQ